LLDARAPSPDHVGRQRVGDYRDLMAHASEDDFLDLIDFMDDIAGFPEPGAG